MERLYYFRQVLRKYYAEYGNYAEMAAKALVMLAALMTINAHFGTVALFGRALTIAGLCLLVSVLPWGFIPFVSALVTLAQLWALSQEATVLFLAALVVICVIFYLTLPASAIVLVVMPVLLAWKVPFAVPVLVGLMAPFTGFVSVASGVAVYGLLALICRSAPYLANPESGTFVEHLLYLIRSLATDREMLLSVLCYSLAALVVWLIIRLSVDYIEYIAIGVGILLQAVILLLGSKTLGVPVDVPMLILGSLLAVALAAVYEFFHQALDYRRKERVRFEDDEYVYYVKAIPRVVVPERVTSDTDVFSEADHALIMEALRTATGQTGQTGQTGETGKAEEDK